MLSTDFSFIMWELKNMFQWKGFASGNVKTVRALWDYCPIQGKLRGLISRRKTKNLFVSSIGETIQ